MWKRRLLHRLWHHLHDRLHSADHERRHPEDQQQQEHAIHNVTITYQTARLLTTINKQESVMADTRIFAIYQIVILEYWRHEAVNNQLINCQPKRPGLSSSCFEGQNVGMALFVTS